MEALGGFGAALIVGLENVFPPVPSEFILPLAGFSAAQGVFSLPAALLWTTAGSVVGAVVVYVLGMCLGRDRVRRLIAKVPLMDVEDFDRTEQWFRRHGTKAVFFGRMVPLFRSLISLPAGVERMHFGKFLLLTALGSGLWNSVFVVGGYLLGASWHVLEEYAGWFQWVVFAAVAVAVVVFVVRRVRARKRVPEKQH
ncbi:DedA family protein [Actinokineospora soli]|uniref:DedA family protein n=1 Tax=Actinokineospora soli TaxID=1048753 RepID=A0ABW2TK07_9PSEU